MFNSIQEIFTLNSLSSNVNSQEFIVNALLLLIISQILSFVFQKFGETLSNRRRLAALFPLLALTTMMIISVIKSSIALSLGLVGALSIVRFRSAIKEPEELAYIFLTISLGLGMGAGQRAITVLFFCLMILFLVGRALLRGKVSLPGLKEGHKMYLEVTSLNTKLSIEQITKTILPHVSGLELKRLDENEKQHQYYFLVYLKSNQQLSQLSESLKALDKKVAVSVLNEETLFA